MLYAIAGAFTDGKPVRAVAGASGEGGEAGGAVVDAGGAVSRSLTRERGRKHEGCEEREGPRRFTTESRRAQRTHRGDVNTKAGGRSVRLARG